MSSCVLLSGTKQNWQDFRALGRDTIGAGNTRDPLPRPIENIVTSELGTNYITQTTFSSCYLWSRGISLTMGIFVKQKQVLTATSIPLIGHATMFSAIVLLVLTWTIRCTKFRNLVCLGLPCSAQLLSGCECSFDRGYAHLNSNVRNSSGETCKRNQCVHVYIFIHVVSGVWWYRHSL